MFDSHEIDAFFNGDKSFDDAKNSSGKPRKSIWLRFVKLGFPCVAAALLGVMFILPNIKKNIEIRDDITKLHKNEMEKLHIEDTTFHITDAKNRVNTITADGVDEVTPGSSEVKISNPKGNIPTDKGKLEISAQTGYYEQKANVLTLQENVHTVVDDGTVVDTSAATYDFAAEYGHGEETVTALGEWGTAEAEGFEYRKNEDLLILFGHTKIKTADGILTSETETRYFQAENKSISLGNVVFRQKENEVRADKVVAYFSKKEKMDISRIEAYGNVVVTTKDGTARGDVGYYYQEKALVELIGNVVIEQNGNFIHGSRAQTDLNTSVSRVLADKTKGERITGTFYNKRKAKNGK